MLPGVGATDAIAVLQAIGPDLLEAIAYAKKMTPEEIEETIDYILNEVLFPLVATADLSLMF